MKEGFTFNYASLKFLEKVIFKNIGGGGDRKEPIYASILNMEALESVFCVSGAHSESARAPASRST